MASDVFKKHNAVPVDQKAHPNSTYSAKVFFKGKAFVNLRELWDERTKWENGRGILAEDRILKIWNLKNTFLGMQLYWPWSRMYLTSAARGPV